MSCTAKRALGERVTVLQPDSRYFMRNGTVIELRDPWQVFANRVRLDDGGDHWFRDDELGDLRVAEAVQP